ncbi:MAG: hypothetical protein KGL46_09830 [Hyphomicrobiales bacterium]|nr:hypothetical protein [Hyphomicrobiales bacterium]
MQTVTLTYPDKPGETLAVIIQGFENERETLRVVVANTHIVFTLRREQGGTYFAPLGGRMVEYAPPKAGTKVSSSDGSDVVSRRGQTLTLHRKL